MFRLEWTDSYSRRVGQLNTVLAIVATIFLPLSFVAGVYGMNFDNMPEYAPLLGNFASLKCLKCVCCGRLTWDFGYRLFWIGSVVSVMILILWMRRAGYFSIIAPVKLRDNSMLSSWIPCGGTTIVGGTLWKKAPSGYERNLDSKSSKKAVLIGASQSRSRSGTPRGHSHTHGHSHLDGGCNGEHN